MESALRLGQCLKEEGEKNLELYRKLASAGGKKPDAEAVKQQTEGYKNLRGRRPVPGDPGRAAQGRPDRRGPAGPHAV